MRSRAVVLLPLAEGRSIAESASAAMAARRPRCISASSASSRRQSDSLTAGGEAVPGPGPAG